MNIREQMLTPYRKEMLAEFPILKNHAEVLPTLGRIVFESDREFSQKQALASGRWDVFPTWEQLNPPTQARWERMGLKIAHLLIEKCPDVIDAMNNKAINVVTKNGFRDMPDEVVEVVSETKCLPTSSKRH